MNQWALLRAAGQCSTGPVDSESMGSERTRATGAIKKMNGKLTGDPATINNR